mgnify:FL=1
MRLLHGYYRRDRIASGLRTSLKMTPIRQSLLWCDEPGNANYNRAVTRPFQPGHENMRRTDNLYDVCLVMDWNMSSRRRNRGSAIFFHLARPGYEPTQGCVAISLKDMRRLLPLIGPGTIIRVT